MSPRDPLDDVGTLPGLRSGHRGALGRMGIETLAELLRLAPRRYEDRRNPHPIDALEKGMTALVIGSVIRSKAFRTRRGLSILDAQVQDATGTARVRWFYRGFLPRALPVGQRVALYGGVEAVRPAGPELKAPELERLPEGGALADLPSVGRFVPVHPCTSGITAPVLRRAVWDALEAADLVADVLPPDLRREYDLPDLAQALRSLHFPAALPEAEAARRRLAFDELLVHELLLLRRRARRRRRPAPAVPFPARVHARIRARLPFTLTAGQEQAVAEIVADLEAPHPMMRLLQGDVGSGKTAVAAYAMLGVVASGKQAAFMAPTEVLARQHARTLRRMLEGSRVRITCLTGGARSAARREALAAIRSGEADIVVGTHAVISDDVQFASLALAVVDEQHKFGVRQRRELVAKGDQAGGTVGSPHCLVMTATPIPRTLALTVWGDVDVSVVEGTIPGRRPVETMVVKPRQGRAIMKRVRDELAGGRQAYVIYPLVEESDKLALKDAAAGHARWSKALPAHRVGLLHGRMKRDEKEAVMTAFRAGEIDLLVATVVVEVGVDVPNATVLVVEHAERFGLSQLHQLRGRIGRGTEGGLCLLVDRARAATPARLEVLAATRDGFVIAEEDLKLRGVGDLFGTRQHGRPPFHAAALPRDLPVLLRARRAAEALGARDRTLERPEHAGLAAAMRARARRLAPKA